MWFKDFPEHDPDLIYAEPSVEEIAFADEAKADLERLKGIALLAPRAPTACDHRQVERQCVQERSAGWQQHTFKNGYPAHESEGQALTEGIRDRRLGERTAREQRAHHDNYPRYRNVTGR